VSDPIPLGKSSGSPQRGRGGGLSSNLGIGALVIAVVVGIQLGTIPWRYRRQIWQLQGFLLGSLVGYVVGRLRAATPVDQEQQGDGQPRLPGR
jgi:hypothetical protein